MKPIRLTMQAFGSYGKKTVIDFTKPSQNLFLITGDTGAGKTTILMPWYLPCMMRQVPGRTKRRGYFSEPVCRSGYHTGGDTGICREWGGKCTPLSYTADSQTCA